MATKKKSFDAVAASRRWRRTTSKLLDMMTPKAQLMFLNCRLAHGPAPVRPARELAHR
jgi:hypothetical protein